MTPAPVTPEAVPARFVVGTGRCGSTLLSRMLAEHPDVVSLHETFTGLDWGRRFLDGEVTGAEVADILSTPNQVMTDALSRGYTADEITYPFRPTDRFTRADEIPWILISTLAYLDDDPDGLYDRTMTWLRSRGPAPIADHYRSLFGWWAEGAGGSAWIERSGSSVDYLVDLARLFPDARVVHIHRDGQEVALSMRNHALYRLAVQVYYGVIPDGIDPGDESPDGVDRLVRAWLDGTPPVDLYGRYWAEQMARGCAAAAALGPDRVHTVAFEDLVTRPAETIAGVIDFFELPTDAAAVARAAALVRGVPPARAGTLAPADRERLDASCRPGAAALAATIT